MSDPTPQDARPLVEVADLHKAFGDNEVLQRRRLQRRAPASVTVLIGPSGSGKTTVLRSLNALEAPDAGHGADRRRRRRLRRAGRTSGELARLRAQSAMVFQAHNLFPHLTVLRERDRGPAWWCSGGRPRRSAAEALGLLDRVGLAAKAEQHPFQLSGGQQQRVGHRPGPGPAAAS